jgi:ribosomal protein S18 acetylase RimI-like enzyme
MSDVRKAARLLRKGHLRLLLKRLRRRIWYDGFAFGLAYDPRVPLEIRVPRASVDEIRPIRAEDMPVFTALPRASARRAEALTRVNARNLLESGLETCYVGVTEDGPVYMQFLITPDQNGRLLKVFDGLFPPLAEDEGLLEFAYTLQQHRARPVMPTVLTRLIEIAAEQGLRRVVTYVPIGNPSLIRFLIRLGFVPVALRVQNWRLMRRRIEFVSVDADRAEGLAAPGGVEAVVRSLLS